MSTYEQQKEPVDPRYQYILFAAHPYETIAFKIPSNKVDFGTGKFMEQWDSN
jgi:splicing factor 3A subunit 2